MIVATDATICSEIMLHVEVFCSTSKQPAPNAPPSPWDLLPARRSAAPPSSRTSTTQHLGGLWLPCYGHGMNDLQLRWTISIYTYIYMGMDQYLLIPFLVGWTSIYQLFWCSLGVPGFDTLPYISLKWGYKPVITGSRAIKMEVPMEGKYMGYPWVTWPTMGWMWDRKQHFCFGENWQETNWSLCSLTIKPVGFNQQNDGVHKMIARAKMDDWEWHDINIEVFELFLRVLTSRRLARGVFSHQNVAKLWQGSRKMMVNLWWFMVNSDIKLIQRQQQSGYLGDGSYMVLWILQGIHLSDIQDKPWAMGRQWSAFSKLLYLRSCQAKRPPVGAWLHPDQFFFFFRSVLRSGSRIRRTSRSALALVILFVWGTVLDLWMYIYIWNTNM